MSFILTQENHRFSGPQKAKLFAEKETSERKNKNDKKKMIKRK